MKKNVLLKYPKYLKEFKCIGGSCEDSCCIGWDIDIDKVTFKQYFKVENKEMKKMFQKNIQNNENCTAPEVDYGKVKLKEGKRCAFLDENNLCMIFTNIGEEYLSNVCTCYPRITNKIDNIYEMSLDVACPEAARILLAKQEGIEFEQNEITLGKHIISSDINTNAKEFNNSPIKYFKEIRKKSIEIVQNRNLDISERLYELGEFLSEIEDDKNIKKYIENYKPKEKHEKNDINYLLQVSFLNEMLEKLNIEKEIDSKAFKEYTKKLEQGFKLDEINNISENANMYISGYKDYIDKYLDKYSYVFENYLVNFIYNNLFPFSESDCIFDGYIMILFRYSLMRFYLVGKYLYSKQDSVEEIISFIQVFSKAVGHHKTYLDKILGYIKYNDYDNLEFCKTLL